MIKEYNDRMRKHSSLIGRQKKKPNFFELIYKHKLSGVVAQLRKNQTNILDEFSLVMKPNCKRKKKSFYGILLALSILILFLSY